MRYLINFYNYVLKVLPPRLRQPKVSDLLKAMIAPLQSLNLRFNQLVQNTFYDVSFNGQVVYLEHILNDRYDNGQRRIYIEDGLQLDLPPYLYNKIEQRPLYLFNKVEQPSTIFLYKKEDYRSEDDFIIYVPLSIYSAALEQAIKSLVKRYKIAGKRFSIQTF